MTDGPIRVGIIGANVAHGWGTRAHIPALRALPEFQVSAVCTTRMETAQETAKQFDIPHAFDDHRQLVVHPEVDLVAVCVRVPAHHQLVMSALEAGKHVFCEWPFGRDLGEAMEMRDLALARGVRNMVGLQGRGAPAVQRMRALIADGYAGRVLSATLHASGGGLGQRPSTLAWTLDNTSGGTTFTIAGGHSIDVLRYCLGEFEQVSATVARSVDEATLTDTGETVAVTAPDNVLVNGRLASGAVASIHIKSVPAHGTGFRFEVHGTEGALVATSGAGAQGGEMTLQGARNDEPALAELPPEAGDRWVPAETPDGPPLNVAQLFRRLGERIGDGGPADPDFADAVTLHELLDAIERASDSGQRQTL